MDFEEQERLCKGWRGRHLLAYRTMEQFHRIIDNLDTHPEDDDLPPSEGFPVPPTMMQKQELKNQVTSIMRSVILWNDGHLSPRALECW